MREKARILEEQAQRSRLRKPGASNRLTRRDYAAPVAEPEALFLHHPDVHLEPSARPEVTGRGNRRVMSRDSPGLDIVRQRESRRLAGEVAAVARREPDAEPDDVAG